MSDPALPASLACIGLAHADPTHLRRLIGALDPFPVFLHCDSDTPDEIYRSMTRDLPDRVTLMPRIRTGWARWENVQAELDGYRAALSLTDATHFALFTGSDYPIASTAQILEFLEAHRRDSIVHVSPLPYDRWGRSGGLDRLRYRHWVIGKRMIRLPLPRRVPADIRFAGGSQLKILAREHAAAVVDVAGSRPDLVRFWRRSWIADETFVPSVLNTPALVPGFAAEHLPDMLWWIGWHGAKKKSPPFLDMEQLDALLSRRTYPAQTTPYLFARKFSTDVSGEVLDSLDIARAGLSPSVTPSRTDGS